MALPLDPGSYPTHLVAWEEFEDYFKLVAQQQSEMEGVPCVVFTIIYSKGDGMRPTYQMTLSNEASLTSLTTTQMGEAKVHLRLLLGG